MKCIQKHSEVLTVVLTQKSSYQHYVILACRWQEWRYSILLKIQLGVSSWALKTTVTWSSRPSSRLGPASAHCDTGMQLEGPRWHPRPGTALQVLEAVKAYPYSCTAYITRKHGSSKAKPKQHQQEAGQHFAQEDNRGGQGSQSSL